MAEQGCLPWMPASPATEKLNHRDLPRCFPGEAADLQAGTSAKTCLTDALSTYLLQPSMLRGSNLYESPAMDSTLADAMTHSHLPTPTLNPTDTTQALLHLREAPLLCEGELQYSALQLPQKLQRARRPLGHL